MMRNVSGWHEDSFLKRITIDDLQRNQINNCIWFNNSTFTGAKLFVIVSFSPIYSGRGYAIFPLHFLLFVLCCWCAASISAVCNLFIFSHLSSLQPFMLRLPYKCVYLKVRVYLMWRLSAVSVAFTSLFEFIRKHTHLYLCIRVYAYALCIRIHKTLPHELRILKMLENISEHFWTFPLVLAMHKLKCL